MLQKYKVSAQTMKRRMLEFALGVVDGNEHSGNYPPAAYIMEEILNQGLASSKPARMLCAVKKLSIIYSLVSHCLMVDYSDLSAARAWLRDSEKVLNNLGTMTNCQSRL